MLLEGGGKGELVSCMGKREAQCHEIMQHDNMGKTITMELIVDAHPVELIGMNSTLMCYYIKFCVDRPHLTLGCHSFYKVSNHFEWMETISLEGKTNLFEKHVGEYLMSGVGVDHTNQTFALDTIF